MRPKRRHNWKRRIAVDTAPPELQRLRQSIRYGGNPEHKRNPGDFGLTPPAQPRPDKTLCDTVRVFEREEALDLLRQGIDRGLVSDVPPSGLPQHIWSLTPGGTVIEAQLENVGLATYHGYPLPEDDPFTEEVRNRWNAAGND